VPSCIGFFTKPYTDFTKRYIYIFRATIIAKVTSPIATKENDAMQKQTLFIIGAGASHEATFPMARELATNIAGMLTIEPLGNPPSDLSGDPAIIDVIQEYARLAMT
jgi:hypothetical protein